MDSSSQYVFQKIVYKFFNLYRHNINFVRKLVVMNQKIHLHINSIFEKAARLIKELSALKNKNENLMASNKELQRKLAECDKNLNDYKTQNVELEKSQSTLKSATDATSEDSKKRNQEIDQIVREIENCIDQLKR